ncbi:MAG: YidC/Oxa1 family membrane protein insertase [Bacillota bacterium]|nr:YidC/Oxa1 family membrane protein insertase [Bacillota bacterium]
MGLLTKGFVELLQFLHSFTGNYGLAIIILTTLVQVALYPLTASQMKVAADLKRINPKLKEIQEKYREKPEELQRRLMELYREHKVNPFGGCLPLLLQLPIIWALFSTLNHFPYRGTPAFLWVPTLAKPDPWILPVLSGATTYLQMAMGPVDPSQRAMLVFMPLFMVWVTRSFPAGLALYWVVGNVVRIIQQWFMNRQLERAERGVQ